MNDLLMDSKIENIDTSSHTGGSIEKRQAWSDWAIRHFGEMKLAKTAGLFPKSEGWRNTVEHSMVVNALSMYVGQKISEMGNKLDLDTLDSGSMLHDIGKRRNKELDISRDNELTKGVAKELIKNSGYSDDVARVAMYSGRVPEIYLEQSEQEKAINNKPIEELITAYSDARVRNTNIVALNIARDKNKEKVPADSDFYDKWYKFYSTVEQRIISLAGIEATELNDKNIFDMVSNEKNKPQPHL